MGAGEGRGGGRYTGKKCRLVSMFSLTVVFFLVEIIVGKRRHRMVKWSWSGCRFFCWSKMNVREL